MPDNDSLNRKVREDTPEIDTPFGHKFEKNTEDNSKRHVLEIKFSETKDIKSDVVGLKGASSRDFVYTELLREYSNFYRKDKKTGRFQKKFFFWFILSMFFILFVISIVVLLISIFRANNNSLAAIISSSISLLGSFIALPTIIAKHLFPSTIDNQIVEIVKSMIDNDSSIREAQVNAMSHDDTTKTLNSK